MRATGLPVQTSRVESRYIPARHSPGHSQTHYHRLHHSYTTRGLIPHSSVIDATATSFGPRMISSGLLVSFVPFRPFFLVWLRGQVVVCTTDSYWTGTVRVYMDPHVSRRKGIFSDDEITESVICVTLCPKSYPGARLRTLRVTHGRLASRRDPRNAHLPVQDAQVVGIKTVLYSGTFFLSVFGLAGAELKCA